MKRFFRRCRVEFYLLCKAMRPRPFNPKDEWEIERFMAEWDTLWRL